MAKRTKKVGILGKYGTRYGAAQRKTIKKFEITQRATYGCPFCGKVGFNRLRGDDLTRKYALGHCEESRCWSLEMQSLQEDCCWWCLVALDRSRPDRQGHRHPSQKIERGGRSGEVRLNELSREGRHTRPCDRSQPRRNLSGAFLAQRQQPGLADGLSKQTFS